MKKIVQKIVMLVLTTTFIACNVDNERLDVVKGGVGDGVTNVSTRAYMNSESAVVVIPKSDQGGQVTIEPRLSGIASKDTQITVALTDFLQEFNAENNTEYTQLPLSQYEMYEENNPSNKSTNGILTVTVKEGDYSSKIVVKVKVFDEVLYPIKKRYAIPFRIVSTQAVSVLSQKDVVVTFQRPFVTSVAKIKKSAAFSVKLASDVPESDDFTVQFQTMYLNWAYYSGTNICTAPKGCTGTPNMTTVNFGYYTRIFPGSSIQVKDGGADGADTQLEYESELNTWYQITYTYSKATNDFKVYVNGEYIGKFARALDGVKAEKILGVMSPRTSYSMERYLREVRLWNRVLSDSEIKDKLYLPLDVETSKGLVAYLPLDKANQFKDITKYNNEIIFQKGTGGNSGVQDGSSWEKQMTEEEWVAPAQVEWVEKVKFPSAKNKLEIAD